MEKNICKRNTLKQLFQGHFMEYVSGILKFSEEAEKKLLSIVGKFFPTDLWPPHQATAPVSIPSSSSNGSASFTPTNGSTFSISWQSPPVTFTGNMVRKGAQSLSGHFPLVFSLFPMSAPCRCPPVKARASVSSARRPSQPSRPRPEPPPPSGSRQRWHFYIKLIITLTMDRSYQDLNLLGFSTC